MQSGITASADLHTAFNTFLTSSSSSSSSSSTPSFALPITITSESLTPLPPIPFHADSSFESSLPQLAPHLEVNVPRYLIVRRRYPASSSPSSTSEDADEKASSPPFTIITYIPSSAPVRAKTLFASTRATLIRELGRERFSGRRANLFLTESREVLDLGEWERRDREEEEAGGGGVDEGVLTVEEREERAMRRVEEEERAGAGRDLMGSRGSGAGGGEMTKGLRMKMDDQAREALGEMGGAVGKGGDGRVVQLSINLATETLILSSSCSDISPAELSCKIPANTPSYTFYHYPSSNSIIFIYCCPSPSKLKERMLFASFRGNSIVVARDAGVEVAKRIEIGAPDEIGEDRLREEMAVFSSSAAAAAAAAAAADEGGSRSARTEFARPKRPGKR